MAVDLAFVLREPNVAVIVAKFGDGEEGMGGKFWEDVSITGCWRQGWGMELTCVGGGKGASIGHLDMDGSAGYVGLEVWARWFEVVPGGAGVGNSVVI